MNDQVSFSKRKLLIVLIVVLSLLLIGVVLLVAMQVSRAKKDVSSNLVSETPAVSATVSPTNTVSVTSTPTVTPTATKSAANTADTEQAGIAATNFMQAKRDRSLGEAKAFMTDYLYQKTDQVEFAGASSPSMSRFEIVSNTVKDFQTFKVIVKSYWLLQNEDAGTINYTLEVMKLGNNFLVNNFDQS